MPDLHGTDDVDAVVEPERRDAVHATRIGGDSVVDVMGSAGVSIVDLKDGATFEMRTSFGRIGRQREDDRA